MRSVWLRQYYQGLAVDAADMQIVLNKNNDIVSQQCGFVSDIASRITDKSNAVSDEVLLAQEVSVLPQPITLKISSNRLRNDGKQAFKIAGFRGDVILEILWAKQAETYVKAAVIRFTHSSDGLLRQVKISRATGELLDAKILSVQCTVHGSDQANQQQAHPAHPELQEINQLQSNDGSSYNVFPYPLESPLYGPRAVLNNPADVQASPFGWHDLDGFNGADETLTIGNNVSAYDDQNDDDLPDAYVDGNAPLNFDFPFAPAPNNTPLNSREAAITQLFYANNRIHDVLWYYGFDEESGNFQNLNYTSIPGDFDAVLAEGFDGSGTNNANFGTPPDGESPRMQMYLWSNNEGDYFTVNSPSSIAGVYFSAVSSFGPQTTPVPVTGQLVEMNDESTNPTFGCITPSISLANKIVLIDRGSCNFVDKVSNAELAGAIGVVVVNNQAGDPFSMSGNNSVINIPSLMISRDDGDIIRAALSGNVNVTINFDTPADYFDSNFDNGVIAHEYGHGVSNRLTGGPLNVDCLYNEEQAGEGWSDFIALFLTSTVANSPDEARAIGNYVQGFSTTGPGIRPYPYSRNMAVNPVTYDDIQVLSIPHGVGSVWCSMLWDLYWNMVDVYGYDPDILNGTGGNNKTFQLVMDGMRLQVCAPGFTDARDAILEADNLNNAGANQCLIWSTFARRGLGYSADQGSSEDAFDGISAFDSPPFCSETDFANFSTSNTTVCVGSTITFTDITEPVSNTVSWTFEGGQPALSSETAVDVTFNTPGTYTATMVSNTSLGTDNRTQTITVVPALSLSANIGNASATADNGFIFITMSGGLPPYQTTWADLPGLNDLTVTFLAPQTYDITITDAAGCSIDTSFTVQRPASINDLTSPAFQLAPNPFLDQLNIRFANGFIPQRIAVYDLSGRRVLNHTESSVGQEVQLSLGGLASGTYLLEVSFSNRPSATRRIVKR